MTLFLAVSFRTAHAVRLLSAIGDGFGGNRIGFSLRLANVAARFAIYRERSSDAIAAAYYAAALHRIGTIRVVVPHAAPVRTAEIAGWDEPAAGAAIVAAMKIFPAATGDIIRWHCEAFDGTGYPDQLRWNGIPPAAMALNIGRAFVTAHEAQARSGSATDAVLTLAEQSGRSFNFTALREFREFLAAESDAYDAPYEPAWPLPQTEARPLVEWLCSEIDARRVETAGRGRRLERIVRAMLTRVPNGSIDTERAAFASRLTALTLSGRSNADDDGSLLSQSSLKARAADARLAAQILETSPDFALFAPLVGALAEWYDGSGQPDGSADSSIDPIAHILAVAIAADAIAGADEDRLDRVTSATA